MKRKKLSINELKNTTKVLNIESTKNVKGGFVIGADVIDT